MGLFNFDALVQQYYEWMISAIVSVETQILEGYFSNQKKKNSTREKTSVIVT
jgi:hypothetical protein